MTRDFESRWNRQPHLFAVIDVQTSRFLRTAMRDERVVDGEAVVDLGIETRPPDLVYERYDAKADNPEVVPYHRRMATKDEIAESEAAITGELETRKLESFVESPVHEASLVYFERERFHDRQGRYPTREELEAILVRQRVVFQGLLQEVVRERERGAVSAARAEVVGSKLER